MKTRSRESGRPESHRRSQAATPSQSRRPEASPERRAPGEARRAGATGGVPRSSADQKVLDPAPEHAGTDGQAAFPRAEALVVRPSKSFFSMIEEAIMNSPNRRLPLAEIYKAIQTRYPYFAQTKSVGWKVRCAITILSAPPWFRLDPSQYLDSHPLFPLEFDQAQPVC